MRSSGKSVLVFERKRDIELFCSISDGSVSRFLLKDDLRVTSLTRPLFSRQRLIGSGYLVRDLEM